jgi:molybdate transport system ATP-binding protein
MNQNTFCMAGGVARNPLVRLAKPITATIGANEHIAIVGPNGGGKSLFVDTLIGKYPLREGTVQYDFSPSATQTLYDNVKYIAFRDTYGAADANYYYQQRWNAHDQDEAPDVREMLGEIKDEQLQRELFELFRIDPLLQIIQSGNHISTAESFQIGFTFHFRKDLHFVHRNDMSDE